MLNLSEFIYKDGDQFYFDLECYSDGTHLTIDKSLQFENGDTIKWNWEGNKMFGTLKKFSQNEELFLITNVSSV
jgi:hypothetical protein